jgi:hypothetical protein
MEENSKQQGNIKKVYNPHLKGNIKQVSQPEKEERIEIKVTIILTT